MIIWHLVRHGETVWHAENRYAGWSDVPLTPVGKRQPLALVPWIAARQIDVIASSDLSRAVETAAPLAAAAHIEPKVDPRLREVSFGRAEGRTRAEMKVEFPDALRSFLATPASTPLPGGESGVAASDRGLAALVDLGRGLDGVEILAVAHTTLIRLILCRALGIPLDDYRRRFPALENGTITTLKVPNTLNPRQVMGHGALIRFNCHPNTLDSSPTDG